MHARGKLGNIPLSYPEQNPNLWCNVKNAKVRENNTAPSKDKEKIRIENRFFQEKVREDDNGNTNVGGYRIVKSRKTVQDSIQNEEKSRNTSDCGRNGGIDALDKRPQTAIPGHSTVIVGDYDKISLLCKQLVYLQFNIFSYYYILYTQSYGPFKISLLGILVQNAEGQPL